MVSSKPSTSHFERAESPRLRLKLILLLCLLHAVALLSVFLVTRAVYGQTSAGEGVGQGRTHEFTIAPVASVLSTIRTGNIGAFLDRVTLPSLISSTKEAL
jgi:hypothetical protein